MSGWNTGENGGAINQVGTRERNTSGGRQKEDELKLDTLNLRCHHDATEGAITTEAIRARDGVHTVFHFTSRLAA